MSSLRRDRNIFVRSEFELQSKRSARTPPAVGSESPPTVGCIRKSQVMNATRAPIPAVVRVESIFGETASPSESFVGKAYNVAVKVMAWIAQMPQEITSALAGSVPVWRDWFVSVSQPPDRIDFLADAEPMRRLWNVNYDY